MEKPFLRLGPKQWLSGIAPSAHTETGGVLYKADGITPLYDAGGTASAENGILQAGPTPTDFTGSVIVDKIRASVSTTLNGPAEMYMLGDAGHFYKKVTGATAPTDLRSGTPISNPATGMTIWGPSGGTTYLYYWQTGQIGRWNLSGSYPTGWTDNQYILTTGNGPQAIKPVHQFVGNVYHGNGDRIGALLDNGAGGVTQSNNVLDFPQNEVVFSLCDDGQYLVSARTANYNGINIFASTKIAFWDTFSSSWTREFEIKDPGIHCIRSKGGGVVEAVGKYGVYEITFGGVRKILSRNTGFDTDGDITLGYGVNRAVMYNNSAFMFATDSTIDTIGKLSPDVPNAYYKPFKVPSGRVTWINADFDAGRVFVATTTPKLYAFDFNSATHDSGNTAQTIYFQLPSKTSVRRIDLVFAEPLASGDAISVGVYPDQDTAVTDFGSATFSANGAIRRKSLYKQIICEEQMSILLTFTSGAVKLKYVDVYGDAMTP